MMSHTVPIMPAMPPHGAAYAPPPVSGFAPAAPTSGFTPITSGFAELPTDLDEWLKDREREVLLQALHSTGFNRTAAAAKLGMNLRQIRYRMSRLGIVPPGGEQGEE